ncbi:MAG TPA: adenylate cyclase, partial [Actinomycetota bacterium]|nr:adenylate cyclase [Actinomycetota bacterium]
MAGRAQISGQELQRLLDLVRDADSVELKLTLPESARAGTAAALGVDPLDAQMRQVFFFDTPNLALNAAGVVVRARRRQGEEADTVIKLRPVMPA